MKTFFVGIHFVELCYIRKNTMKVLSFASIILLSCALLSADDSVPDTSRRERSFLALPIAFYTTDTGFAGGIAGVKSYRQYYPQSSTIQFNTIFTEKHQSTTSLKIEQFLREGKDRFNVKFEYQ